MNDDRDFIDEDELQTFEGWERYQAFDPSTPIEELRATWEELQQRLKLAPPPVGRMKLPDLAKGELCYGVSIETDDGLRLGMWVRRTRKGEVFVMLPHRDSRKRGIPAWNPHASYHLDGTFHLKTHDKPLYREQRQPIIDPAAFRGIEALGGYAGYGPKTVGAICEPSDFTGLVRVPRGVLGPRNGMVSVYLMEPGRELPPEQHILAQEIFREAVPWLAITVTR